MTITHTLPNSYLIDTGVRYRFGPIGAPLLTLNTADDDGVQWWCDVPDGWDGAAASTPLDARQYGDGAYAGPTTYTARTLSFGASQAGLTVAPDALTAARAARRLLEVVNGRDYVLYTQDTPEGPQSLWLRASGQPKLRWTDEVAFEWSAVMVADDPFRFDAAQLDTPVSTHLPLPGGATYPLTYALTYGAGGSGIALVVNDGDEAAQATYTLAGPTAAGLAPVVNPTVTNTVTGATFTVARTLYLNDRLVVDTRAGTVLLNGYSVAGEFSGDFPLIMPGPNPIVWSAVSPVLTSPPADADALLTVAAASTWR